MPSLELPEETVSRIETLHLSPQFAVCPMPPALFNWTTGPDFTSQDDAEKRPELESIPEDMIVVLGEKELDLTDVLVPPPRSQNSQRTIDQISSFEQAVTAVMDSDSASEQSNQQRNVSNGSLASSASRSSLRAPPSLKSSVFFLHLVDIVLKNPEPLRNVFITIKCGDQTFKTKNLEFVQDPGRPLVKAKMNTGYYFDLATSSFSVSVRLFGTPIMPKTSPVHSHLTHWDSQPQLLGEVSFQLTKHKFGKLTGNYGITLNGKREAAKLRLGMGCWVVENGIVEEEELWSSLVNVELRKGNGGSVLKRYMMTLYGGYNRQKDMVPCTLRVFDADLKQTKAPVAELPLQALQECREIDFDEVMIPYGFELVFNAEERDLSESWSRAAMPNGHLRWFAANKVDERTWNGWFSRL